MASWIPGKDPCGAANCTANAFEGPVQYPAVVPGLNQTASPGTPCQWEGIPCTYARPHRGRTHSSLYLMSLRAFAPSHRALARSMFNIDFIARICTWPLCFS